MSSQNEVDLNNISGDVKKNDSAFDFDEFDPFTPKTTSPSNPTPGNLSPPSIGTGNNLDDFFTSFSNTNTNSNTSTGNNNSSNTLEGFDSWLSNSGSNNNNTSLDFTLGNQGGESKSESIIQSQQQINDFGFVNESSIQSSTIKDDNDDGFGDFNSTTPPVPQIKKDDNIDEFSNFNFQSSNNSSKDFEDDGFGDFSNTPPNLEFTSTNDTKNDGFGDLSSNVQEQIPQQQEQNIFEFTTTDTKVESGDGFGDFSSNIQEQTPHQQEEQKPQNTFEFTTTETNAIKVEDGDNNNKDFEDDGFGDFNSNTPPNLEFASTTDTKDDGFGDLSSNVQEHTPQQQEQNIFEFTTTDTKVESGDGFGDFSSNTQPEENVPTTDSKKDNIEMDFGDFNSNIEEKQIQNNFEFSTNTVNNDSFSESNNNVSIPQEDSNGASSPKILTPPITNTEDNDKFGNFKEEETIIPSIVETKEDKIEINTNIKDEDQFTDFKFESSTPTQTNIINNDIKENDNGFGDFSEGSNNKEIDFNLESSVTPTADIDILNTNNSNVTSPKNTQEEDLIHFESSQPTTPVHNIDQNIDNSFSFESSQPTTTSADNFNDNSFSFESSQPTTIINKDNLNDNSFEINDFTSASNIQHDNDGFGDFNNNDDGFGDFSESNDNSKLEYEKQDQPVIIESLPTPNIENEEDSILYNSSINDSSNNSLSKSKPIQFSQSPLNSRKSTEVSVGEGLVNSSTPPIQVDETRNIIMPSINSENLQSSHNGTPKIPFTFNDHNIKDSNEDENDEFGDFGEFKEVETKHETSSNSFENNQFEDSNNKDQVQNDKSLESSPSSIKLQPPTQTIPLESFNDDFDNFKESNTKTGNDDDDFGDFGDFNETNEDDEFGDFGDFKDTSNIQPPITSTSTVPKPLPTKPSNEVDEFGDFGDFGDSSFPPTSTPISPGISSSNITISDLHRNISELLNENIFVSTLSQFKQNNKDILSKSQDQEKKSISDLLKISTIDRQIYMQPAFATDMSQESPIILKETEIEKQFILSMNFSSEILAMVKKFEHERVSQPLKPISTTVYIPSTYNRNNDSNTSTTTTTNIPTPTPTNNPTSSSFEFIDNTLPQTVKPINLGSSDASTLLGIDSLSTMTTSSTSKVNPFDHVMSKIPDLSFMLANTLKIPAKVNHRIPTAKFKLDQSK